VLLVPDAQDAPLNKQALSFGIISKLMVFRAKTAVLRMSCAPFVILLSPVVVDTFS
jgi:hypothetical protein